MPRQSGCSIRNEEMIAVELHNLGHVELHRGNVATAERYFDELAQLGAGTDPYGVALTHLNEAVIAFARGDPDRARELLVRVESRRVGPSSLRTTSSRSTICVED
jgi:hypothetical protein